MHVVFYHYLLNVVLDIICMLLVIFFPKLYRKVPGLNTSYFAQLQKVLSLSLLIDYLSQVTEVLVEKLL